MPEIKHVFSQGKMNKDLDERLVPNGQYRDAMNIQVSTSEASDVGAVQNILGNVNVFPNNQIHPKSVCVGVIADEKNNCFYWFVYHNEKNLILKFDGRYVTFVFVDTENVLKFSNSLVTGINIIDDFLFWTDNDSEPKKINVIRSINGTDQTGDYHTCLEVPKKDITKNDAIKVREEHITVIKKSPKTKLVLDPVFEKNIKSTTNFDFASVTIGSLAQIYFNNFLSPFNSYKVNDILVVKENDGSVIVRMKVTQVVLVSDGLYEVEFLSLSNDAITSGATYNVEKEDISDLFERKFIRFGYRYKYQDGEYSSFSPFTDVVFKPDLFEYSAKDAYNKAMENNLISLKLRNFITAEMPEDVVQVDILYKESNSPVVYIVDKLKYQDPTQVTTGGFEKNYINANLYEITSDLIFTIVESNQLLRTWDNVPRKAKAQEITGNRLVYGNYVQNYDVVKKPILQAGFINRFNKVGRYENVNFINNYFENQTEIVSPTQEIVEDLYGQKSLKSIRNYQLGLTYLDKYNRETPIFTSSESIFNIPKKYADDKLKITGQVRTLAPDWAESFKVYIKETSTEYYNLAMSRVYNAEDGNVWLAFPSAERNKVDEETFLILKKSVNTDNLVEEEAKYKILAIENEAPEYITQEIVSIAEINCGGSTSSTNVFGIYSPVVNSTDFRIVEDAWTNNATESLDTITEDLVVYFKNTLTNEYTKTYNIESVSLDNAYYKITLDKVFETQDAELIYPNYPTTTSGGVLDLSENLKIIVSKKTTIEESPQFKGMFFVKINNDRIVESNVLVNQNLGEYEIVNTMPTHYFADNYAMPSFTGGNTDAYNGSNTNFTFNYRSLLDFGGTSNPLFPDDQDFTGDQIGGFFIDKSWYAGIQSGGGLSPSSYQDTGNNSHVWQNVRNLVESWRNETNIAIGSPVSSSGVELFPSAAAITAVFTSGIKRWYFYNFIWDWFKNTRMQDNITPGSNINVNVHPFLNSTSYLFPNNPPIRWFNPDTGNYDTLPSTITYNANPAFGKGVYTGPGGDHFVEVSFSAITPDLGTGSMPSKYINNGVLQYGSFNTSGAFDIRTALQPQLDYAVNYSTTDDKLAEIANNMKVGKRFKIRSDDNINNIYTITKVERIKRYNNIPFLKVVRDFYGYTETDSNNNTFVDQSTFQNDWDNFGDPINRRYTFRLRIENENGNGLEDVQINSKSITHADNSGPEKSVSFQFLEPKYNTTTKQKISDSPAIWETEPKETADLDIYYEASEIIPLKLNGKNNQSFIPLGSVVTCPARPNCLSGLTHVVSWDGNKVTFSSPLDLSEYLPPGESLVRLYFTRPDNSYTTLAIDVDATLALEFKDPTNPPNVYVVQTNVSKNPFALSWFNCFSFGNGVESNRIRDDFNQPIIDKGVKVSTILEENYEEEKRSSGLIYSGIYNTNSGINNLNQFIQAEKITKDLNPTYGSIQKLFSRNTDLIAFCEDRIIKILANKDAVFNADGNTNLVATANVLGQSIPFAGDYGISKNPESFAADNYRAYFTDKQRGAVLRLSMDGITPISEYGMSDYFKDNLKLNGRLIGSFDIKKNEYNLTMPNTDKTVSFKESVNGWSSFKSFVPEQAISVNGDYYTLKNSLPYQHHLETYGRDNTPVDRNTFYNKHTPSSISVLLNDTPNVIKMYKTLGYEGSQSNVDINTEGVETGYYNLENKDGWKSKIKTDKQEGVVSEFIEKEGKWFNYIKGINFDEVVDLRTKEFSFQGVGRPASFKINFDKPVDSDPPPPPPPPPSPFLLPSFSFTYGPPLTNLQGQQNPNIISNISWQGQTWALMSFTLDVQPALNIPSNSSGVEYEITELYYIDVYSNQVSLNYIPSGGLMTPPYNLVGSGLNYIFQNYNNSNTLSPLVSLFTTPELITSSVQAGTPFNIDGAIFLNPPTGITGTNWPIDITCTVTATDSSGVVASHTEVLSITV